MRKKICLIFSDFNQRPSYTFTYDAWITWNNNLWLSYNDISLCLWHGITYWHQYTKRCVMPITMKLRVAPKCFWSYSAQCTVWRCSNYVAVQNRGKPQSTIFQRVDREVTNWLCITVNTVIYLWFDYVRNPISVCGIFSGWVHCQWLVGIPII